MKDLTNKIVNILKFCSDHQHLGVLTVYVLNQPAYIYLVVNR